MLFYEKLDIDISNLSKSEIHSAEHQNGLILCKALLKKHFGIENPDIKIGKNGKPYIDKKSIHFNVSHSHGRIVCAVSDTPVGIDVEKNISRTKEEISKFSNRFFTSNEISYIKNNDYSSEAFYYIWTKKEAYSKMLGCTLDKCLKIDILKEKIDTFVLDDFILSISKE